MRKYQNRPVADGMLSWRLDPQDSFSDYAIHIHRCDTATHACGATITIPVSVDARHAATSDVYHVHRAVLAFGPYASEYFKAAFRHSNTIEGKTRSTHMTLTDDEADMFPFLLDCIYGSLYGGGDAADDDDADDSDDFDDAGDAGDAGDSVDDAAVLDRMDEESLSVVQAFALLQLLDYLAIPASALFRKISPVLRKVVWSSESIVIAPDILCSGPLVVQNWCLNSISDLVSNIDKIEEEEEKERRMEAVVVAMDKCGIAEQLLDILVILDYRFDQFEDFDRRIMVGETQETAAKLLYRLPPESLLLRFSDRFSALLDKVKDPCSFQWITKYRIGHLIGQFGKQ